MIDCIKPTGSATEDMPATQSDLQVTFCLLGLICDVASILAVFSTEGAALALDYRARYLSSIQNRTGTTSANG